MRQSRVLSKKLPPKTMIAYLKGKILKKTDKNIILDTGNVGYLVFLPINILAEIQEKEEQEFFIHTQVREDALDLYGFNTYKELTFFKNLISISGIGPKVGLDIMSAPIEKTKAAILNEDTEYLRRIPGIGPKIAKRIILELKGKIAADEADREYKGIGIELNQDAIDALIRLGYQKHQIIKILKDIPKEIQKAEDIITFFLKNA